MNNLLLILLKELREFFQHNFYSKSLFTVYFQQKPCYQYYIYIF